MSELLSAEFVEHHIRPFPWTLFPDSWGLQRHGLFYELDLKMCQIQTLDYSFVWGSERTLAPRLSSVLETPSKIVKLDISLNELTSLLHDGLSSFRKLRALDASLNQLRDIQGIEVLHHLCSLNLSHNNIKTVIGLQNCHCLRELNLSNNLIENISSIPSLTSLHVLIINNNKLKNLVGVSSFPKLEEIYTSNNELTELMPLSTCLHLRILSCANNQIKSLDNVLRLIRQLRHLQSLDLSGNPVGRDATYQADILRTGNIITLDNVFVKHVPSAMDDHKHHAHNIYSLRDAAREAFEDRLKVAKERMEENINFLQRKIVSIQIEYKEFEHKLETDLEACMRYFDSLGDAELSSAGRSPSRASHSWPDFWQNSTPNSRFRRREPKNDYSNIKDTDEVLRCTYNELIRQRDDTLGY